MTLYTKYPPSTDGTTVVIDNSSGADVEVAVLKPGQWQTVLALPHDQQRARVDELVAANGVEWAAERGPDSALGRGIEAGTPTTDHSSDPGG